MTALYDWPRAAAFGRVIPKNKIYEHADAGSALKDSFVREVDQIIWAYKLAPETINLTATKTVAEIQIFRIMLRTLALDPDILRAIDRAIPFPLIFELMHGGKVKVAAAYKRPSDADNTRWVVGEYFESGWIAEDTPRRTLPVVLDMDALYERLLSPLVIEQTTRLTTPLQPSHERGTGESLQAPFTPAPDAPVVPLETRITQAEAIQAKVREVERIRARLTREKQFNKRVAINAELRAAKNELERLKAVSLGAASTSN
ncbi:DUF4391 domain-containing protein [Microvirga sp. G4-2]|uniref:DUF4391 domain-containing protein n=1 Tax=Microvirga sp. G4-2 TaxID=3434467 RepID=UPI004044B413